MENYFILLIIFIFSFIFSLLCTYIILKLAFKFNWVDKPKSNRWNKKIVAKYGGVCIALIFYLFSLLYLNIDFNLKILMYYCLSLFILGLIDDIISLKPHIKFAVQICASTIYISLVGPLFPISGNHIINFGLSLFWLIGITNAFNLLDNMDGLSAGIAAIASIFYIVILLNSGKFNEVIALIIFLGSLLGFLVLNFNPAKIFMGDAGSYFIGSFMASYIIYISAGYTGSLFSMLFVPIFILFIPIIDTTFVTYTRLMTGRPVYEGGVDHTSHRLVFMGLSEKKAVLFLYTLAAVSGLLAIFIRYYVYPLGFVIIPLFMIFIGILGSFLSNVKINLQENGEAKNFATIIFKFTYKRKIFEICMDVVFIVVSLVSAFILRFEEISNDNLLRFLEALPIFIILQIMSNYIFGIYEGIWKYTSIRELIQYLKSSFSASAASMLILLYIYRFYGHSRSVYIIYGILYFIFLSASRISFKIFQSWFQRHSLKGNNALLYGAGDAGELAIREILNNPKINLKPIGFIDDDPLKKNMKIHGFKVLGSGKDIERLIKEYGVKTLIITPQRLDGDFIEKIGEICNKYDCKIMNVVIKFDLREYKEGDVG